MNDSHNLRSVAHDAAFRQFLEARLQKLKDELLLADDTDTMRGIQGAAREVKSLLTTLEIHRRN